MIIVFKPNVAKKDETAVLKEIERLGYRPHIMRGVARTVVGAIGDELTHQSLESLLTLFPQAVESVMPVQKRFKLVSREAHPADSTINVRGALIGGRKIQIMAGPCSVESETQLLTAAAQAGKPGLLKRGVSRRIEEWLLAGEYVLANGNPNLMFCERGIRTFETYTRNTLDLAAIPIVKQESHCPIVIDPSQGSGRADLVTAMCKGAVAMGADALLIEVHPNPAEALSDGAQQISLDAFARLMTDLKPFLEAAGRA